MNEADCGNNEEGIYKCVNYKPNECSSPTPAPNCPTTPDKINCGHEDPPNEY